MAIIEFSHGTVVHFWGGQFLALFMNWAPLSQIVPEPQ